MHFDRIAKTKDWVEHTAVSKTLNSHPEIAKVWRFGKTITVGQEIANRLRLANLHCDNKTAWRCDSPIYPEF